MAIGGRNVDRGESRPKESLHSPILEQLEPRLLLSGSEWLPGLVGSNDFLEHTNGQVIYLDFDGADDVTYNGPVTVEDIDVPAFTAEAIGLAGQEVALIEAITAQVTETLVPFGVTVTTFAPETIEYSTFYIGGTDEAFSSYGRFNGVAETVDIGNTTKADDAFVFTEDILQGTPNSDIAVYVIGGTIVHEAGHLLGLRHKALPSDGSLDDITRPDGVGLLDVAHLREAEKEVHQWIAIEAYEFYDSQFAGSELSNYMGHGSADQWLANSTSDHGDSNILEGTHDEDNGMNWMEHFVQGGDGDELFRGLDSVWSGWIEQESAYERAGVTNNFWGSSISTYSANKSDAYYLLGRVTHLLEDMTVPAHVHNDGHPAVLGDEEYYEQAMGFEHTTYGRNFKLWGFGGEPRGDPTGDITLPSDLESLFRQTVNYTEDYPSTDVDGEGTSNSGRHRPLDVSRPVDIGDVQIMGDDLMPWAMEQTAALFRLFYSEIDHTAPSVQLVNLVQHDPNNPGVTNNPSITIYAAASDTQSGVGVNLYTFQYREKAPGGAWGSWENFNSGDNVAVFAGNNGSTYGFRVKAEDGAGNIGTSQPSYVLVQAQPGNSFTLTGTNWDDGTAQGDDDGVMEAGERVRLKVSLRSDDGAQDVDAVLSTSDPLINITDADVYYDHFSASQSQWSMGSFTMELDFPLGPGQTRTSNFTLHVTYELDGQEYYQDLSFSKTFYHDGDISADFEVISPVTIDDNPSYFFRNNGDGVLQTGEEVRIRPQVRNSGASDATDLDIEFYYSGIGAPIEIRGSYERYVDLDSGQAGYPETGEYYRVLAFDYDFTGIVDIGMLVDWDENNDPNPVEIPDVFQLTVAPAPIIDVGEYNWDFGVVDPGDPVTYSVTYSMRVTNAGSGPLSVTDIQTSHADTSVPAEDKSFTLAAGEFRDVVVTINTSAIPSGSTISRTVTVISDGQLGDATPPSNQIEITGLVSSAIPVHSLSASPTSDTFSVDISGSRIVWQEDRNGNRDIYMYDVAMRQETRITTDPASQGMPRISGDIVAWRDYRNWDGSTYPSNTDIYALDLSSGTEFVVANSLAGEDMLGVDGDRIAYYKQDFTYTCWGQTYYGNNVYYYDVSDGTTTKVTDYGPNPGQTLWAADNWGGDFADGVLAWTAESHSWIGGGNDWDNGYYPHVAKHAIGVDTGAVNLELGFDYGPATSGGRVIWTDEDSERDSQLFMWQGSISQVTYEERDHGDDALAISGDIVVYDKRGLDGLYYWDLSSSQEHLLTNDISSCESVRMDGNGVVWLGWDPGATVYYTFLAQPDIAISSADLTFSNEAPEEGEAIDVSAIVRNLTDYDMTDDITVRLYDGDHPDAGGTQLGSDQTITGGLARQGQATVTFVGIAVPENVGVGDPESHNIYARIVVPGVDNPSNNTAQKALDVYDDDIEGPIISNVVVAEHNGDGDGIIGADEQILISWDLTDPSGIGPVELLVDGNPVARDGDYHVVLGPLDADGFNVLEHDFIINATDADNSPASSQYTGSFDVVPAEEITVLYGGQPVLDGEATPIDFGQVDEGTLAVSKLFIVRNDGQQMLSLGAISVPEGFTVTGPESSVIAEGGFTYFTVTLDTSAAGVFSGDVSVANGDGPRSPDGLNDENPFTFAVAGTVNSVANVVGRHVFYNNSAFDGNDPAANPEDDDAIDTSKQVLLPGETASPANYTSYSRGINGIMVDIAGLNAGYTPVVDDFGIRINESPDTNTWANWPAASVDIRRGDGVDGSDRVTLIWTDGTILDRWVEVTVLSDANGGSLGLADNDVFYFPNVVGDCDGDGEIGSSDYATFVSEFGLRGGIGTLAADLNGDGRVDLTDFATMRGSFGNSVSVPSFPGAAPPAVSPPTAGSELELDVLSGPTKVAAATLVDPAIAIPADDTPVVSSAPAADLLVESLSAVGYISGAQAISGGLSATTLYRAATAEYDLRPLGDGPATAGEADDLLVDVLADSCELLAAGYSLTAND